LTSPAHNEWSELGFNIMAHIKEHGDYNPSSNSIEHLKKDITHRMSELLQNFKLNNEIYQTPLTLGGDHSITGGIVPVISHIIQSPVVIIHFDAHPDIYADFSGNKDSHASPFARILEFGRNEKGEVVNPKEVVCERLIQIGLRTIESDQKAQIEKYGVRTILASDVPHSKQDLRTLLSDALQGVDPTIPIYVSVDIDVIEPVSKLFISWFSTWCIS